MAEQKAEEKSDLTDRRECLERHAGETDLNANAEEFERLSRASQGDLRGWTFNREELHERK